MKFMKVFCIVPLLILLCCLAIPAFAANYSVTVLEKGTGDPIEGATVVLGETGEYDITDDRGIIHFDDVEMFLSIKVLSAGYETLEKPVNSNKQSIILYLHPISVEGEALEVVESRIKEKSSKITLVDEELRRVPGTAGDPLKVMESLPGVVVGQGQGPGQIYIRGSGTDDNGVLINRIPVPYLYHFGDMSGVAPSTINPSLIKDFNAFLGGFPVEYEDKLGGILDVQLRNPKKDRIHQTYRLAIHESAFLIEGPVQEANDNDSFYVAGRISYLDRLLTPSIINKAINGNKSEEDSDISFISLPRYYDAQANWHRELKKGSLDVYYFAAGDSLSLDILDNAAKDTDPAFVGNLAVDLDYQSLGTNWLHRYNNRLTQITTLTFRQFNSRQNIGTDPLTDKGFFVNVKDTTATFDPQLIWRASSKHEFTAGASINRIWAPIKLNISAKPTEDNPDQNFTIADKFQIDTTLHAGSVAPYLKHRWAINNKLTSIIGLRYSYLKASGGIEMSGFSPRAALEYQFNEQLLLNASWGKYLQFPDGATVLDGIGNPRLGFTQAEHRILGLEYKPVTKWLIKVEAYQKPMEKLVLYVPEKLPPDTYVGTGEGEAYGVDVLIKREFSNNTLGWLSYSYAKSSRTNLLGESRKFTGDQPHTLTFVWSQPMTGSWKRWTWGVKMAFRSGATYTPVIGRTAYCLVGNAYQQCTDQNAGPNEGGFWQKETPEELNTKRLPFDSLMSIRLDRDIRFNTWKMNVFFDIQNIRFEKKIVGYDYGDAFEDYKTPKAITAFAYPIPLFGIEAKF